jgi:hypothetical protein
VEGARQSWRDPAGASPAQVGPSKPPGSECCVRRRQRRTRSIHSGCVGCVIEPRNDETAGAEAVTYGRTQYVQCRYARHCRPAGVEEHITRKWIASEPGRSWVWPSVSNECRVRWSASGRRGAVADDARAREVGPRHSSCEAGEQSGVSAAEQSAEESAAAESVEQRTGTKGNAARQSTHRTQCRACVSQTLDRMRQAFAVWTRGRSRVRESRMHGSVRGALSNERPYRDRQAKLVRSSRCKSGPSKE